MLSSTQRWILSFIKVKVPNLFMTPRWAVVHLQQDRCALPITKLHTSPQDWCLCQCSFPVRTVLRDCSSPPRSNVITHKRKWKEVRGSRTDMPIREGLISSVGRPESRSSSVLLLDLGCPELVTILIPAILLNFSRKCGLCRCLIKLISHYFQK